MTDYFDDHLSISSHNSSFMLFDDDIFFEQNKQKCEFDPCGSFKMPSSPIVQTGFPEPTIVDQLFNFSSFVSPSNVSATQHYESKSDLSQQFSGKNLFSNFLHLINLQQIEDTKFARTSTEESFLEGYSPVAEPEAAFVFSSPSSPASSASPASPASSICSSMESPISISLTAPTFVCSTPLSTPLSSPICAPLPSFPLETTAVLSQQKQQKQQKHQKHPKQQKQQQQQQQEPEQSPVKQVDSVDYYKLWVDAQQEISKLEQAIDDVTKKINQLEEQNSSIESNIPTPAISSRKLSQSEPPSLSLRVCSEFQRTWYTDRAFPSFTVGLFDSSTLQPYLDISGWRVVVSLIDGHGKDATAKICGTSGPAPLSFAISRGRSVVNGLRFSSVSSKNGGCFQLVMRVVNPFGTELPTPKLNDIEYLSEPIQILSYRLFHVPKLESDMLFPSDPLWKVKGIGPLYAKRFGELGIATIKDLASIDLESLSEDEVRNYVNSLRRDRGALTPAKLFEYVSQARQIVSRDSKPNGIKIEQCAERDSESINSHPAKRVRVCSQ